MANLINEIWPFGQHCNSLIGEVSEETKVYLIESGKAKEEDFEQVEEKPKTKKQKENK
jgi:hypothetical protein